MAAIIDRARMNNAETDCDGSCAPAEAGARRLRGYNQGEVFRTIVAGTLTSDGETRWAPFVSQGFAGAGPSERDVRARHRAATLERLAFAFADVESLLAQLLEGDASGSHRIGARHRPRASGEMDDELVAQAGRERLLAR